MKKFLMATFAIALLGACANDGSTTQTAQSSGMKNMGSALVKSAIDSQCRTELNNRDEWRMIALAMSADKQREWEGKICGCASEEAPNQLTAADMTQLLSDSGRAQVVANVTVKTVTACFKRLYQS